MANFTVTEENPSFENAEEQLQEIEVLDSIYGPDFCRKDLNEYGQYCFQVACKVLVDEDEEILLEPIILSAGELKENSDLENISSDQPPPDDTPTLYQSLSGHAMSKFPVKRLPPIILDLVFPKEYPTQSPPEFSLKSEWLDGAEIGIVRQELLQLWDSYVGSPIVFFWCDFLANNLLSIVGNEGTVRLTGNSHEDIEDRLMSILQYNQQCEQQAFLENDHLCGICFTEKSGLEFFRLQKCKHHFCTDCFEAYCNIHVKEGSVQKLQCPDPECEDSLPPHLIKAVVSPEDFERWERLSLQKTLDSMSDLVYCPRCSGATIAENENLAQCPQCYYCFCGLCQAAYHPGEPCVTGGQQAESIMKKLAAVGKERIEKEVKMQKTARLKEELDNLKKITTTCKQCPNCKMFIEKDGGCNKMTCSNCGTFVCWKCGKQISGYEHFREGTRCSLWEQDTIKKWNAQMEQQARLFMANHDPNAFMMPQRRMADNNLLAVCPQCKCRNYKTARNNHIHCFGCRIHFCMLCKQKVQKSSEHFGPGKCRQHSD